MEYGQALGEKTLSELGLIDFVKHGFDVNLT